MRKIRKLFLFFHHSPHLTLLRERGREAGAELVCRRQGRDITKWVCFLEECSMAKALFLVKMVAIIFTFATVYAQGNLFSLLEPIGLSWNLNVAVFPV